MKRNTGARQWAIKIMRGGSHDHRPLADSDFRDVGFIYCVHCLVYAAGEKMIRLSAWARLVGVCHSRAVEWARTGRINASSPVSGVWIVSASQQRPEHRRPWHDARAERIEREKISA